MPDRVIAFTRLVNLGTDVDFNQGIASYLDIDAFLKFMAVTAVVANLDVLAFEHSVDRICDRLRVLYRDAQAASPRTFVNLDMEEYRDLPLTLASLRRVLDEPEFEGIDAGVVLQAYLPDSHAACDELCTWAVERHRRGGGTLKVRIVKGANLAMEHVDAVMHDWPTAPYDSKLDTDANYVRCLEEALRPENTEAVRIAEADGGLRLLINPYKRWRKAVA